MSSISHSIATAFFPGSWLFVAPLTIFAAACGSTLPTYGDLCIKMSSGVFSMTPERFLVIFETDCNKEHPI